mmetsp:Transcript_46496/g.53768  ORF Transcript_46496/g.53768 Transcript_46496/m.53768 type:complete len:123 (-) Transcript_46496:19-387(-)
MDKWKKKVSCGPVINGHKGIDPDAIKNMKNISYKTDNKRYNNINVSHRTPANRKKGRVDRFCLSFESIGRNRNMKSPPIPSPTYPLTQIKHHTIPHDIYYDHDYDYDHDRNNVLCLAVSWKE